jgi:DNA-binding MarR family transcriptional regulator
MTRWLADDELDAWVRLVALVELLPGVLESQLKRDSDLTHFEYYVLAMLSEAPDHRRRMSALAAATHSTLPRLSHVVSRLEARGLVLRSPCPLDRRAANAERTDEGWELLRAAAPGHVEQVRTAVFDVLSAEQVRQLSEIGAAVLSRLDPDGAMTGSIRRR